MTQRHNHASAPLLVLAIAAGSAGAHERGPALEELVLTSAKREQTAKDVPISVSVETRDSLRQKNIRTLQQLALATPGLFLEDRGITHMMSIRGMGNAGLDSLENAVGTYIDGVYMQRNRITRAPLFDMERTEVLRGPQSTLYGRNTIAGAVNLTTAKPTRDHSCRLSVEGGNFNQHTVEGHVSDALSDTVQGRLAVLNSRRGGWIENDWPGGEDAGGEQAEAYRASLRIAPSSELELLAKYEHQRHALRGIMGQLIDVPGVAAPLLPLVPERRLDRHQSVGASAIPARSLGPNPGQQSTADLLSLQLSYALNDQYTLKSITGGTRIDGRRRLDNDASPYDGVVYAGSELFESWSQELRLEAYPGDNFSYITGLYLDDFSKTPSGRAVIDANATGQPIARIATVFGLTGPQQAALAPYFGIISPLNGEEENRSWSAYWEGTWALTEQLDGLLGLRLGEERKRVVKGFRFTALDGSPTGYDPIVTALTGAGVAGNVAAAIATPLAAAFAGSDTPAAREARTEQLFAPSLKLQYHPDRDSMYYASASAGTKSGGFTLEDTRPVAGAAREDFEFDREKAVAFEVGAKFLLANGAAQLNLAAFHTTLQDMQVSSVSASNTAAIVNVPEAVSQGLELEGAYRLTERFTVGASYGYLDAHYTDFPDAPCGLPALQRFIAANPNLPSTACSQNLAGADLQRAPENSASAYATHTARLPAGLELETTLSATYRDVASLALANDIYSDELTTLNARVSLIDRPGNWSLSAHANNLTGEDGLRDAQRVSALGVGAVQGTPMEPRSYALSLELSF